MSRADLPFWILCIVGVSAYSAWTAITERRKRKAVDGWRKVRGRIREARTCEVHITADEEDGKIGFEPLVLYDYRVDGEDLVGTRVGLSPPQSYMTSRQAASAIKRYKPGYEIEVYVDPTNPNHALLDPRVKADWMTPIIGLLLIAALLAFVLLPRLLGR